MGRTPHATNAHGHKIVAYLGDRAAGPDGATAPRASTRAVRTIERSERPAPEGTDRAYSADAARAFFTWRLTRRAPWESRSSEALTR